jgi:hypothetical protein
VVRQKHCVVSHSSSQTSRHAPTCCVRTVVWTMRRQQHFEQCVCHVQWVADFEKPKGDPALFDPPATTVGIVQLKYHASHPGNALTCLCISVKLSTMQVLSPYLKFGCISPRLFHSQLTQVRQRWCNAERCLILVNYA